MGYSWREHTSELELHVEAASEREVFEDALQALGELAAEEREASGEPGGTVTRELSVAAADRAALLAAWVGEGELRATWLGHRIDAHRFGFPQELESAALTDRRRRTMAWMLMNFQPDNYDEWKQVFDSDPVGRKAVAKGHRILRAADNPNEIFLGVEYPSVDDAKTFRDRLLASGVLDRFPPKAGPTVVEVAEETRY